MACERPVVASAVGGIPEVVVDGETGVLVPVELRADEPMTPVDPARFEADLAAAVNGLMADASLRERWVGPGGNGRWSASAGRRSPIRPWRSTEPSSADRVASRLPWHSPPRAPLRPTTARPSPSGDEPVLVARDLRKKYGTLQAVDGVSFEVASGEVFGILGPNGAGKTTTLEMIEGMRTIDSGSAIVDGIDVAKDPRGVKSRIGIQLQASSFFDELSLVELLRLFGRLYGVDVDAMRAAGRGAS